MKKNKRLTTETKFHTTNTQKKPPNRGRSERAPPPLLHPLPVSSCKYKGDTRPPQERKQKKVRWRSPRIRTSDFSPPRAVLLPG